METDAASPPGALEQRAAELESAVLRSVARFKEIPLIETLILRLVVLLGREISALLEHTLKPHGLNETDYRTLMMLFSQPNGVAHPSDLCASMAQSPANLTRVADGLCERGLITRVPSDEDRRRTILHITSSGEALVRALLPDTIVRVQTIFDQMPPSARRLLLEQLRALVSGIDQCENATALAAASAPPTPHTPPSSA